VREGFGTSNEHDIQPERKGIKMANKLKKQLRELLNEKRRDKRPIYKMTKKFLESRGELFITSEKEAYFYHRKKKELHNVTSTAFQRYLASELYFDRTDPVFKGVIKHLEDHAYRRGQHVDFYKFAHYDEESGKLYVNQFGGNMYVLNGKSIKLVDLGTDGVFFNDPDYYEPFEMEDSPGGLAKKHLFAKANFKSSKDGAMIPEDQEFVLKNWVHSLFFRELLPTKPILVLYGPPNSYKTETARSILTFLFGQEANVCDPPPSPRDLNVIANANHVLFLDDFSPANKNLEKPLVRISTGMTAAERELYTNKGVSVTKPDVFTGLTAKLPYFSHEDFLQRCLILRLENGMKNIASQHIKKEILENRNRIWSEVLHNLNKMVARLKKQNASHPDELGFRMADWGQLLLKANPKKKADYIKTLLSKINRDQITFLIESNSLAQALSIWLEDKDHRDRWFESGAIRKQMMVIAKQKGLAFKEYENDQIFGSEMANVTATFERIYQVQSEKSRGRKRYRFSQVKTA
jgi:hypothetical protein